MLLDISASSIHIVLVIMLSLFTEKFQNFNRVQYDCIWKIVRQTRDQTCCLKLQTLRGFVKDDSSISARVFRITIHCYRTTE